MLKGHGDKVFDVINYTLLFLLTLVFIYPLYFINKFQYVQNHG